MILFQFKNENDRQRQIYERKSLHKLHATLTPNVKQILSRKLFVHTRASLEVDNVKIIVQLIVWAEGERRREKNI